MRLRSSACRDHSRRPWPTERIWWRGLRFLLGCCLAVGALAGEADPAHSGGADLAPADESTGDDAERRVPTPVIVLLKTFDSEGVGEALLVLREPGGGDDEVPRRFSFRVADTVEAPAGWPEVGKVYHLVLRRLTDAVVPGWVAVERPVRIEIGSGDEDIDLPDTESYLRGLARLALKERVISRRPVPAAEGAAGGGSTSAIVGSGVDEEPGAGDPAPSAGNVAAEKQAKPPPAARAESKIADIRANEGVIVPSRSKCRVLARDEHLLLAYRGDLRPGVAQVRDAGDDAVRLTVSVLRCDGRFAVAQPLSGERMPERCYLYQYDILVEDGDDR